MSRTWHEPLRLEWEEFIRCVRTGEAPLSDGEQGLTVVAVLEAAGRSLATGSRRIPVETPCSGAIHTDA